MGLSIHYKGNFKKEASLQEMIEEVKDIAEIYTWEYTIYETAFPQNSFTEEEYDGCLYGISFTPAKCETISLTFLSNGKMCSNSALACFGNSNNEKYKQYLYLLSTKTQFAGSTTHKIILHLLKYISQKYLNYFELSDEGNYWETESEAILEQNFKIYNDALNSFEISIKSHPINNNESFTEYFDRIIKTLNSKRSKK